MPSARLSWRLFHLILLLLAASSARGTRWDTTDRAVWKRIWLTPSKNLELRWAFDKTSGDAKMAVWSSCKGWWGIGIKQKGYGNCVQPIFTLESSYYCPGSQHYGGTVVQQQEHKHSSTQTHENGARSAATPLSFLLPRTAHGLPRPHPTPPPRTPLFCLHHLTPPTHFAPLHLLPLPGRTSTRVTRCSAPT